LKARNQQLLQLIAKGGFKDEAQFEYVRLLVKWEMEKRQHHEKISPSILKNRGEEE
jgi:hypothetical protein